MQVIGVVTKWRGEEVDAIMDDAADPDWDEISFVIRSQYRVTVLEQLMTGPATPSKIAAEADLPISHISRALSNLQGESLVELLVSEDQKKGRVYGITDRGQHVVQHLEDKEMV